MIHVREGKSAIEIEIRRKGWRALSFSNIINYSKKLSVNWINYQHFNRSGLGGRPKFAKQQLDMSFEFKKGHLCWGQKGLFGTPWSSRRLERVTVLGSRAQRFFCNQSTENFCKSKDQRKPLGKNHIVAKFSTPTHSSNSTNRCLVYADVIFLSLNNANT